MKRKHCECLICNEVEVWCDGIGEFLHGVRNRFGTAQKGRGKHVFQEGNLQLEKQKSLTNMASSLMTSPEPVPGTSSDMQVNIEQEQEHAALGTEPDDVDQARFCVAVSLNDGLVQHTTNHPCA